MRFLGTKRRGSILLIGVPLDQTVSYRPGTRFAPMEIRKASDAIETYSPYLKMDLEEEEIADAGDIELSYGRLEYNLSKIEKRAEMLLNNRALFIGGEHLISYPIIKALSKKYSDLIVVHIDAHLDLRNEYLGQKLPHATVMRRISELGVGILHIGIRSGTKEEFQFASENATLLHKFSLTDIRSLIKNNPIYISIDLDVLDPAFCPGVGTPEPGGISYRELVNFLTSLTEQNIVGADLVELCPLADPTGNSSVVAASLVREMLLLLANSSKIHG